MKTAGAGGWRERALKAEEMGTGWPDVLSVPATRLYCPSTGRQDRARTTACPETHLPGPAARGLRLNKGKQTHGGVALLCFHTVISFCVTLNVCDCHMHGGFLGAVSASFLGASQVPGASGPHSLTSHFPHFIGHVPLGHHRPSAQMHPNRKGPSSGGRKTNVKTERLQGAKVSQGPLILTCF